MISRFAATVGALGLSFCATTAVACPLNGGKHWVFRKQPPTSQGPYSSVLKVRVLAIGEDKDTAEVEILDPVAGIEGEHRITVRWDGRSDCTNAGEIDGTVFVVGRVWFMPGARLELVADLQTNPAYEKK